MPNQSRPRSPPSPLTSPNLNRLSTLADAPLPGPARRARLRHHRSRRGLSSRRCNRQPLPCRRGLVAHLHPPHLAQGLRLHHRRCPQRRCRIRRGNPRPQLPAPARRPRRIRRDSNRCAPRPQLRNHRRRTPTPYGSQQIDIARFLERLHNEVAQLESDHRQATREEQYALNQLRARLAREGDIELRNRTRDLESKLASLAQRFRVPDAAKPFAPSRDRTAQQKLSKEAERRILRSPPRVSQESFNQTVVAHRTGSDIGDANAQPHLLNTSPPAIRVLIKSMNKVAVVTARNRGRTSSKSPSGPIKMRVKRDGLVEALLRARGGDGGLRQPASFGELLLGLMRSSMARTVSRIWNSEIFEE